MKTNISIILSLFILTGCVNLSPNYEKPTSIGENKYFFDESNLSISSYKWWEEYNHKELNSLMEIMLKENQDILSAKKQINLNLENINIDNSYYLPNIDIKNELTYSDLNQLKTNKFGININTFELDYLGAIKNKVDTSKSDLKISALNLEYLKMISSYDLVNTYFSICSLNEQIKLTQEKIKTLNEIKKMTENNIKIGLISKSSIFDKELELNTEERNLQLLKIKKNNLEKSLKTIIGKDINIEYFYPKLINVNEEMIASNQIEERFDIKIAEEELKKQNAKIGIARTQYFPKISLSAFLGIRNDTSHIFGPSSNYWTISPSIVFNVFDFGKTTALVEQQKILKEQALIKYTKVVRLAFIDVRTNYLNYKENKNSLDLLSKNLTISLEKFDLLKKKEKIGLTSKLELLLHQNIVLSYKLQKEIALNEYITGQINLRKSLQGKIN